MILSTPEHYRRAFQKEARLNGTGGTILENFNGMAAEGVDLPALAEAIYLLLKAELRLEHERRGWHQSR